MAYMYTMDRAIGLYVLCYCLAGGHGDHDGSTGTLTLHNITALLLALAVIILIVTGVSTLVCCVCFIRYSEYINEFCC